MTVLVWVDGWQLECCGEPFGVGGQVEWHLDDAPDLDWLATVLGPATARRIAYAEQHHGEPSGGLQLRRGTVVAIQVASCAYVAGGADGRSQVPVAGSTVLRSVSRVDGAGEEPSGRGFTGYVVEVELDPHPDPAALPAARAARRRPRGRRRLVVALTLVVGAVAVVLALAVLAQRALVFYPDATPVGSVAARVDGARDVTLRTDDGLELGAWLLPPTGVDRRLAVLYLPGNGGNRLGRLDLASQIAARGFTVLLMDYRGYGGNPGSPSQAGLASDARAAVAELRSLGFDAARTVYVGESIGTGVAAELTSTDPPAAVLLRSPFTSLTDVAGSHVPLLPMDVLLRDRFESAAFLAGSDVPISVLYGDADDVVPPRFSTALAAGLGNLHALVVVEGAGHNDEAWFGPFLVDHVVDLVEETASDRAP